MCCALVPKAARGATLSLLHGGDDSSFSLRRARRYDLLAATLHALRAGLGYALMLAVMTYAIEFSICAVLGMVAGRHCLTADSEGRRDGGEGTGWGGGGRGGGDVGMADVQNRRHRGNDATWGGGDPCCGIEDDEDDDDDDEYDGTFREGGIREPLLTGGVTRRALA